MIVQREMIDRVRQLCRDDKRIVAAWMYGSFTKGEGDAYSDIEFCLYLDPADLETFDPEGWISQIAPVALYFVNEFGNHTVIFENLVRGEFHFESVRDMERIRDEGDAEGFPPAASMFVTDRTGDLTAHLRHISGDGPARDTGAQVSQLWVHYLNWILFGMNVLARGERARALELLWFVQRYLLRLVRIREGRTEHWLTPSKGLEAELSTEAYTRYVACTASLAGTQLEDAYRAAWAWGRALIRDLDADYEIERQDALVEKLDRYFAGLLEGDPPLP